MTKLNKDFKYERLLEQAGVANVSSRYLIQVNPVQCKRDLKFKPWTAVATSTQVRILLEQSSQSVNIFCTSNGSYSARIDPIEV